VKGSCKAAFPWIVLPQLSLCALVAAGIFLLAVGFALRQFRAGELTRFGKLVAIAFASAVSVRDFSGPLCVVSEGRVDVQNSRNEKDQSNNLHLFPHAFSIF
jgi:hypothetical protein